jgi:hypothetical protein
MDPFHEQRTRQYLGAWFTRQPRFPFWTLKKPHPIGPVITANLSKGFCGLNDVYLSRVPAHPQPGKAGWAVFLLVLHQEPLELAREARVNGDLEKGMKLQVREVEQTQKQYPGWESVPTMSLVRYKVAACVSITRTTFMTLLALTNARQVFRHSGAAGHRAGYGSYSGQWYIEWPLGAPCVIRFAAHDSHSAATDVYPPSFHRRIDTCVEMMAGVISTPTFKCAFTGRKPPGRYILEHVPKGFPGAHGSRHLYNMMGGKVFEVDFLSARKLKAKEPDPEEAMMFELPSTTDGEFVNMFVREPEREILRQAMDCLPWSPLSWSLHRGLQDLLLAFSKDRMDKHRTALASMLRQATLDHAGDLEDKGWEPTFVRQNMGDMAVGAVMAGSGWSGDLVRVVTDIALTLCTVSDISELDVTTFWRSENSELSQQAVVALTKCFILEWSVAIDYQMYHDLPLQMYFA